MEDQIRNLEKQFAEELAKVDNPASLEALKIRYLGRQGLISGYFQKLSTLDSSQRPGMGQLLNALKEEVSQRIRVAERDLSSLEAKEKPAIDTTLPGLSFALGHKHILTQTIEEVSGIFEQLGFVVVEGPEIETEYYNFRALNIPPEHPAQDTFHTFYLDLPPLGKDKYLLRSQTSTVQIRVMEKYKPPLRIISPGKVYRPDATDASHSFMFHQIEGFLVDRGVRFSDLKGTLFTFGKKFFGQGIKLRFRPHYFPFTEPSVEVDISCIICQGKGCRVCGKKGWLEILGAGMIHPHVLRIVGYDTEKYTGFAFGLGVERMTMLRYGIDDIRLFFENDLRFLTQF